MAAAVAETGTLTLAELRERYRHYGQSVRATSAEKVKTRLAYLARLFDFLGPPETAGELLARLGPATIDTFLADYALRHGPGSRRDMHAALRSLLCFTWEEGYLPRDLSALVPTVRDVTVRRLPKALPEAYIAVLEQTLGGTDAQDRRDAAIVCLLKTYGVRGAQIRRLLLEHIDWERERLLFPACKGGNAIEQHLTTEAGNRLADWLTEGRPPSCYREVFLDLRTGTPLTHSRDLSRIVERRLREAGVCVPEGVSCGTHGFRHAFATRMVGKVPFKDLADMLGHRSPASTLAYSRVDIQALRQAALPWPGDQA